MSKETSVYLNQNVLIGYTDKRGTAWHYRAEDQGVEPNHYTGAIPIDDVKRRLFAWQGIEGTITATALTDEGVIVTQSETDKAIMRSDTGAILGIFKQGYSVHQYGDWLVDNVEIVLGNQLQIGSAGLLKGGAQAWVQIEMPETLTGVEGVEFRPFLTAATSMDGSLATTYLTGVQVVVCDNTLSAALSGSAAKVRLKHTRYSGDKSEQIREGLGLVEAVAASFEKQLVDLTSQYVPESKWQEFVQAYAYVVPGSTDRMRNAQLRKQGELNSLWQSDPRVAPWKNNAYGVVAAVNTYEHHVKNVKGATRAERNASRVVSGGHDKLDRSTLELLATIS
jgi:phage/plasmid-like protein (TIGR03299 family)